MPRASSTATVTWENLKNKMHKKGGPGEIDHLRAAVIDSYLEYVGVTRTELTIQLGVSAVAVGQLCGVKGEFFLDRDGFEILIDEVNRIAGKKFSTVKLLEASRLQAIIDSALIYVAQMKISVTSPAEAKLIIFENFAEFVQALNGEKAEQKQERMISDLSAQLQAAKNDNATLRQEISTLTNKLDEAKTATGVSGTSSYHEALRTVSRLANKLFTERWITYEEEEELKAARNKLTEGIKTTISNMKFNNKAKSIPTIIIGSEVKELREKLGMTTYGIESMLVITKGTVRETEKYPDKPMRFTANASAMILLKNAMNRVGIEKIKELAKHIARERLSHHEVIRELVLMGEEK